MLFPDGESCVYSRLMIILCGGPVIIIQVVQNSVTVDTLFLPSKVVSSACVNNRIMTTDAVDCVLNILCLEGKPRFESSIFPVKGIEQLMLVELISESIAIVDKFKWKFDH